MVKFETREHPTKGPLEYVSIPVGVDVVQRPATEEDKRTYYGAYETFKAGDSLEAPVDPPVPPVFFEKRVGTKGVEVEYVSIATGKDRVHRQVTEEDKVAYPKLYAAFHPQEPAAEPKAEVELPVLDETQKSETPSLMAKVMRAVKLTPTEQKMEEQLEELAGTDDTPADSPSGHHKKKKK